MSEYVSPFKGRDEAGKKPRKNPLREHRAEIEVLIAEGIPYQDIAGHYGVTIHVLSSRFPAYDYRMRPVRARGFKFTNRDIGEMHLMRVSGATLREIGEKFGVSHSTVSSAIASYEKRG